jgi:hypothetical protein
VNAEAPRVATIGVYGFDLDGFLDALRRAGVGELIDVRQRRGVRGRDYARLPPVDHRRAARQMPWRPGEPRGRRAMTPTSTSRPLRLTSSVSVIH